MMKLGFLYHKLSVLSLAVVFCGLFFGCKDKVETADYQIIPLPKEINVTNRLPFQLTENTIIFYSEKDSLKREAEFLAEYISDLMKKELQMRPIQQQTASGIFLMLDTVVCQQPESYRIDISSDKIVVKGFDAAGVFYGIQTLRKSMPAGEKVDIVKFPAGTIVDYPQFAYRGMHLDVARHFIALDSIKRYIDMMALHNMNQFHLHLTEDQGWRMEIKRYPELTYTSAWRKGTVVGRNTNLYDSIRHGGFYTQKELRDLVAYAAERHINIIPEIDLPGHMQAALAAFPQFGCTGGPYEVWCRWGVSDEVICAGNETAMKFLEDVLNEVMDVFPSEIIHIGGDECPKTRWHECPKCQAKIAQLGLRNDGRFTAEDHLQSYVMNRMEKVVKARGRRIIGWDEILEGSISKSAMIMSWRGTSGGITAAKKGHDVVMAPCDYLYFSQGQSLTPENEPVFADGYLPVERVYAFRPLPEELTEKQQAHILGVQGCIWGEYVHSFKDVEYDALPRMAALSELQWCKPQQRDYKDFINRCFRMAKLYDLYHYNYAHHIFDLQVEITPDYEDNCINIVLSKYGEGEIRYTLDGKNPKRGEVYTKPIEIRENADFRAILIRPDGQTSEYKTEFRFSKSSMKPIILKEQPHENYAYEGAPTLIDGLHGNENYRTGRWIGFWGIPLEATIDLQQPTDVQKVAFHSIIHINDWIYNPKSFTVLVSDDGEEFREVANAEYPLADWDQINSIENYELKFDPVNTRFVRVVITGHQLPEGHTGYGHPAWLFVDEIEVE
jgi:hexosaminidase